MSRAARTRTLLAVLAVTVVSLTLVGTAIADPPPGTAAPTPTGWTWDSAGDLRSPDGWTWDESGALISPSGWTWDGAVVASPLGTTFANNATAVPLPNGWTWDGADVALPNGWTWDSSGTVITPSGWTWDDGTLSAPH